MRIKKFNESVQKGWDSKAFCVIITDPEGGLFGTYNYSPCFTTQMLARDYLIKYINEKYHQNFEPYYTKEGDRFFADLEENEDYDACIEYCYEEQIHISVEASHLYSKPRI